MKTINDIKIKLPLMKDCRVDHIFVHGRNYSILVDYMNNCSLYAESGVKTIGNLYKEFKWCCINECPISTMKFIPFAYPFKMIENVIYNDY